MLEGNVNPNVRRALTWLENFLIRRSDLLITVGEKLRRHFEERGARRSVVVGNWKKLEEFARSEEQNLQIRRRLGIPAEAMTVVCISQLFVDRQIPELLDALEACPGVWAIIGGKGALEEMVRERAALNPRIRFVGFVRGPEIPLYTCASDVVYYGFDPANPNARFSAPNKLFEALAAGRPLITGDFGEIGEVVREASCGIVLSSYSSQNVRQALLHMREPAVREPMAKNARHVGRTSMNWQTGEEVLRREYAALLPSARVGEAKSAPEVA
jgi:glycosyltransferase involved in cell wall biosynthesis